MDTLVPRKRALCRWVDSRCTRLDLALTSSQTSLAHSRPWSQMKSSDPARCSCQNQSEVSLASFNVRSPMHPLHPLSNTTTRLTPYKKKLREEQRLSRTLFWQTCPNVTSRWLSPQTHLDLARRRSTRRRLSSDLATTSPSPSSSSIRVDLPLKQRITRKEVSCTTPQVAQRKL